MPTMRQGGPRCKQLTIRARVHVPRSEHARPLDASIDPIDEGEGHQSTAHEAHSAVSRSDSGRGRRGAWAAQASALWPDGGDA